MDVLMLTLFASLLLVGAALLFFHWNLRQRSHEHLERLAILPLADDEQTVRPDSPREERDGDDAHNVR